MKKNTAPSWVTANVIRPVKHLQRRVTHPAVSVPTASLPWNHPPLPDLATFPQNQWSLTISTAGVECVTTTAVVARNMMNRYLAGLSGREPLPGLQLQDYIDQTDTLPKSRGLPPRFPSNQKPLIGVLPIAGWMHPRLQLLKALRAFAAEFESAYGCSFEVEQSAYNTLEDIASELEQDHLVLVHGLYEPADLWQKILGGAPHTRGPVVSVDAGARQVTLMDTNGSLVTEPVEKFMEWWGKPSLLGAYTRPYTMTVIIPGTLPTQTP